MPAIRPNNSSKPKLLPGIREGMTRTHNAAATDSLLNDLRSDEGMGWVPDKAWLTKLSIDSKASDMTYDLAVDAEGDALPSAVAAGLEPPANSAAAALTPDDGDSSPLDSFVRLAAIGAAVLAAGILIARLRPARRGR